MKSLSAELKQRRLEKAYTQAEVANLLNITWRHYVNYENDHWPPHEQLLKLNTIFQYDFSIHIYGRRHPGKGNKPAKRGHTNNAG